MVLGISPDSADAHQRFAQKFRIPFNLLCDPDKKVMKRYGAWGPKMMYGVKRMGVIRSTIWVGTDGKVKRHWKKVTDAAAHPEHVLDALSGKV